MSRSRFLLASLFGLILILISCGSDSSLLIRNSNDQAVAELDALPAPAGVDPLLFAELKRSLRAALRSGGKSVLAAQPPASAASQVKDLRIWREGSDAVCLFTYANQGDYNQDSQVGVSDLTPLGVHFDRCSSDAEWPLAQVADGNGDGLIALNDVTPIGQYFGVALEGYILQESESGAEPWNEVARLPLSSSTAPIAGGLRLFAATIPGLTAGRSYRVVPVLGADTGVPSTSFKYLGDPRPTNAVSGMVYRSDGTPVGGVAVVFGSREPVSTDSAGQFEIAAVPDGESGVLSASAAGTYFLPRQRYVHVSSAAVTDQDFTAFAAAGIECTVPATAIARDEVSLELRAVDNAHAALAGFNVTAGLACATGGMVVVTPPLFTDGVAQAKVRFESEGAYTISLTGLGPPFDATLGQIEVTELRVCKWRHDAKAAISLSFDDGTEDHWTRGMPLWEEYGFHVTLGILASRFIDHPERIPELQQAFDAGHELANHTTTHPDLSTLEPEQVRGELEACENLLRDNVVGLAWIDTAIYPYEEFDAGVIEILLERGYLFARSGAQDEVVYTALNDAWNPPRYHLYSWANINTMSLNSWNVTTDAAVNNGSWLIEQCHGIGAPGEAGVGWSPRPESEYRNHYDHIKSYGDQIWVAPVSEVGRYLLERNQASFQIISYTRDKLEVVLNTGWEMGGRPVPLSVLFVLPAGWDAPVISQAGHVINYSALANNRIIFDAIPGEGVISATDGA